MAPVHVLHVPKKPRNRSRARNFLAALAAVALLAPLAATGSAKADSTPSPADSAPAASAFLTVTSTPSARLFVDGNDTSMTTPVTRFPVAVGHHNVKLVADGRPPYEIGFTIKDAGAEKKLNVNF